MTCVTKTGPCSCEMRLTAIMRSGYEPYVNYPSIHNTLKLVHLLIHIISRVGRTSLDADWAAGRISFGICGCRDRNVAYEQGAELGALDIDIYELGALDMCKVRTWIFQSAYEQGAELGARDIDIYELGALDTQGPAPWPIEPGEGACAMAVSDETDVRTRGAFQSSVQLANSPVQLANSPVQTASDVPRVRCAFRTSPLTRATPVAPFRGVRRRPRLPRADSGQRDDERLRPGHGERLRGRPRLDLLGARGHALQPVVHTARR